MEKFYEVVRSDGHKFQTIHKRKAEREAARLTKKGIKAKVRPVKKQGHWKHV